MFKRVITTVAQGLAMLLVLFFLLTVLLTFQDFFTEAMTWLLCACIAILMLFVLYLMVSRIIDAIRRSRFDENKLNENTIAKIFSGEDTEPAPSGKTGRVGRTGSLPRAAFAAPEAETPAHGKHVYTGERRNTATMRRIGLEADGPGQTPAHDTGAVFAPPAAAPPPAAPAVAAQGAPPARAGQQAAQARQPLRGGVAQPPVAAPGAAGRPAALGGQGSAVSAPPARAVAPAPATLHNTAAEAAAPRREPLQKPADRPAAPAVPVAPVATPRAGLAVPAPAPSAAQALPAAQPSLTAQAPPAVQAQDAGEAERRQHEAAALRKAQAIASARKQAEAAAIARRRAAQTAAMSQTFPAISADAIPAFNSQVISRVSQVTEERPAVGQPEASAQAANIWDKMQVRQSAAPVLPGRGAAAPAPASAGRPADNMAPAAPLAHTAAQPVPATPRAPGAALRDHTGGAARPSSLTAPLGQAPKKPVSIIRPGNVAPPAPLASGMPPATAAATGGIPAAAPAAAPQGETAAGIDSAQPAAADTLSPVHPAGYADDAGHAGEPAVQGEEAAAVGGVEEDAPRKRGRPPKPKTEEELNQPKRPRGRPPKPKTEEELNQPKRPRGRPPKNQAEADVEEVN